MTLSDLIPEIEIGKQYLWRMRAMEFICSNCGHMAGSESEGQEHIVTIEGRVEDYGYMECAKCGYGMPINYSGWYTCWVDGVLWGVPYTQLEEVIT